MRFSYVFVQCICLNVFIFVEVDWLYVLDCWEWPLFDNIFERSCKRISEWWQLLTRAVISNKVYLASTGKRQMIGWHLIQTRLRAEGQFFPMHVLQKYARGEMSRGCYISKSLLSCTDP